jgi:hypothetical protein
MTIPIIIVIIIIIIIIYIIHRLGFSQTQCFGNWLGFRHQVKRWGGGFLISWVTLNELVSITLSILRS